MAAIFVVTEEEEEERVNVDARHRKSHNRSNKTVAHSRSPLNEIQHTQENLHRSQAITATTACTWRPNSCSLLLLRPEKSRASRRRRRESNASFGLLASHTAGVLLFLVSCLGLGLLLPAEAIQAPPSPPPAGAVPCDNQDQALCSKLVGTGSECVQGLCSNPFMSGCLRALLGHETTRPTINSNRNNNERHENQTTSTAYTTTTTTTTTSSQEEQSTNNSNNTNIIVDPTTTLRVCNSDDDQEFMDRGLCLPSPLDYMEIRILTGNWESSLLTAWAMQILLSEFLQIPTSIESSSPDVKANFYDPQNQFDYGAVAYDYAALEVAHKVGDCRQRYQKSVKEEIIGEAIGDLASPTSKTEYKACAHIMPEVWNGQTENLWSLTKRGIIEAPEGGGVVGKLTWYIPKYVAEKYPELGHYRGWQRNRTFIASSFLRPLTWYEYCQTVSESQCETSDGDNTASRPPLSEDEKALYFDVVGNGEGYRGYFQATESNNCTANPNTCVGEIFDSPCDWSSFAVQQAYHLGIAVQSSGNFSVNKGWSYGQKLQIWSAANASKNNIVMTWYTPDPTYQWYRGTEAEFQEVQLPPPSPECVMHRVTVEERCSEAPSVRVGDEAGSCGAETQTLDKVVVRNLYRIIYHLQDRKRLRGRGDTLDESVDDMSENEMDAKRSPAYEAVKNFQISEFDIGKMFQDWRTRLRERGHAGFSTFDGTTGADPRHVVCQWVADNAEHLQSFIPFTYPRVLEENNPYDGAVFWVAIAVAMFVSASIGLMGIAIYLLSDKPAFKFAQLPFLYMVWFGLLLVSGGAIVYALEPQSGTCVARSWLVTMGYTLELVPLIVKIGAIDTMLHAAKKMRRVKIERKKLFGVVGGICLLTGAYLTVWTVVDPPSRGRELTLQLEDGDLAPREDLESSTRAWWSPPATTITVSYYCRSSGSPAWFTISIVWQCLLLLCAAVLALQTRRMHKNWNESKSLAIMIYIQSGFVVIRFLMWLFEAPSGISAHFLDVCRSFILSIDALLALSVYFGSKLIETLKNGYDDARRFSTFTDKNSRLNQDFSSLCGTFGRTSLITGLNQDVTSQREAERASVKTSLIAGDIIMSQASSRRLDCSSSMQPLCPKCKQSFASDDQSLSAFSKNDRYHNAFSSTRSLTETSAQRKIVDTLTTHVDDEGSHTSSRY